MDRQLRDLLDAAVGEPPHEVSVPAVRRRVTRRRVREAVGIPAAVAVLAAAGVTAATGVFGVAPGPAAGHRPATVYVSYPGKYHFAGTLAPISTATNTAGQPIRIGTLGGLAFTPDGKTAYVEGPTGAIIPISTATNTPGQPIPVPMPGYRAYDITMNPDGKTAYLNFGWSIGSSFSDSIVPISTATNATGKPIRVYSGKRPFVAGIVFSPGGKTAYVAVGSLGGTPSTLLNPATITPISTATNTPGQPIRLRHGVSGIAITPDGKTVYADSGGGDGRPGYVTAINTATSTPGTPIRVSTGARTMAITPDGKTLYVAGSDTITPISTATSTPGTPIRVSTGADTMAITPDGKTLYVGSDGPFRGAVIPISTATNRAGQPIPVAAEAIAITPDGKTLYAAARQGVVPISTATNTPGKPIRPAGYRGVPMLWISP
jgi:DNA-binding beta-propeller fold protein YncE